MVQGRGVRRCLGCGVELEVWEGVRVEGYRCCVRCAVLAVQIRTQLKLCHEAHVAYRAAVRAGTVGEAYLTDA